MELPTELYGTFAEAIDRVQKQSRSDAELGMQVLMWLHLAYRPLALKELQHALAVDNDHTELDPENIPPRKA